MIDICAYIDILDKAAFQITLSVKRNRSNLLKTHVEYLPTTQS